MTDAELEAIRARYAGRKGGPRSERNRRAEGDVLALLGEVRALRGLLADACLDSRLLGRVVRLREALEAVMRELEPLGDVNLKDDTYTGRAYQAARQALDADG
jgi:hypothetical protein